MKITHAFMLTSALFPSYAYCADYVLGLPSSMEGSEIEMATDAVVSLSENLEAGDHLIVLQAMPPFTTVADIAVTEKNKNRRRRELSEPIADFTNAMAAYKQADPVAEYEIMFPQFMAHVSTQVLAARPSDQRNVCLLVVGNAQYHDSRNEVFSMRGNKVPADGLVLASQHTSPYGTSDRQGLLNGYNVHFAYKDAAWESSVHELRSYRTWSLFTHAQGGTLSTFSSDTNTAIERWMACESGAGRNFSYDSTRDSRNMLHISQVVEEENVVSDASSEEEVIVVGNDDWLTNPDAVGATSSPNSVSGSFKLGIRWGDHQQCSGTDLDLYVRSNPSLEFLYFSNKTTDDGRFNKDIRSTSQFEMSNGMEYVDLTDIRDIGTLEILVNHYAGNCPEGVKGEVRAYFNGQNYILPFEIEATSGNSGRGRNNAVTSPNWSVINVQELFNLNT